MSHVVFRRQPSDGATVFRPPHQSVTSSIYFLSTMTLKNTRSSTSLFVMCEVKVIRYSSPKSPRASSTFVCTHDMKKDETHVESLIWDDNVCKG